MIMTEQLVVDKITVIKYCTLLPAVKDDKCNYYIKMYVKMLRHSFAHTLCNWDKLDMTTMFLFKYVYLSTSLFKLRFTASK